ncbi:FAD-binding protein [Ilumatobacter nonamiensis]|uniref:FAD-binding protein n=1 Tax=Ilumatobacter nonamiensis TaxID=467093 RepID=UPI000349430B|nr:FAD-binding protein [Ilumatobacter nonamiensis]
MAVIRSWGGNREYRAVAIERPATLGDVQRSIAESPQVSVIGTRHTFNDIGDGEVLVDLSNLASPPVIDRARRRVSVSGATTYSELTWHLDRARMALHNLASLPHLSVAGATATGTHGSGSALGNLSTAVESVEMITADGDVATFHRGDDYFDGAVVHLGALGVVTRLELALEETYSVEQTVFDGLDWETLASRFDEVFDSATSVSVFTRWGATPGALWCKRRVDDRRASSLDVPLTSATSPRNPIPGIAATGCTEQGGVPGPWWDRWPHFRADAVPSAGAEIQSEFFVDRGDSVAAIEAIRAIGDELDEVLLVSEIRTIAGDDLWMSPCHGRDSTAFHFTWRRDSAAVETAVELLAQQLEPFAARPHWGKVFPTSFRAATAYERLDDFLDLRDQLDPGGRFTTPWFERHVL